MVRRKIETWARQIEAARLARGRVVQRAAHAGDIHAIVTDFRAAIAPVDLIRIGGEGDGGYLVPDDLDGIGHCFSPGVSVTADFEEHIARRYGIRSFLADASVERPPFENPLFEFDRKFLGARCDETFTTLGRWVADKLGDARGDLLLQMDIEGAEFDVLIESDAALLRRFRIMVIEFHDMERMFERHSLPLMRALFAKLHRDFAIVHMHANNCCGIARCRDIEVPRIFEVTYLRRDRLAGTGTGGALALPHPLDRPNVPANPDIVMPEIWWRDGPR